jgi:omega-6 fatty acid desaturase (delta-12 desaturase)
VFVPHFLPEVLEEPIKDTGLYRLGNILVTLTLGWPLYLFTNASGRQYERFANHFDPYSPIFSKRERVEILISDMALITVVGGLGGLAHSFGWLWLLKVYIIPYLIVNNWLVTITLLQHTHPNLPHYKGDEWDWLRGALATVDRSYGFLDHFFHHIADTHVAHHLFSAMPHYHAEEATEALKPILGEYYTFDKRNVHKAMWSDWRLTHYVAPDKKGDGTLWYRK